MEGRGEEALNVGSTELAGAMDVEMVEVADMKDREMQDECGAQRRFAFVVNPNAGDGNGGKAWRVIEKILEQRGVTEWSVSFTEATGHGVRLAEAAIREKFNVIVSVGGDGTHNEVMNGILLATGEVGAKKEESDEYEEEEHRGISMGIVPIGTGGDLQRTFNTEKFTVAQHLDVILEPGSNGASAQSVDIGSVTATPLEEKDENGEVNVAKRRYYINISSCGISGAICHAVNNSSKALGGFCTFLFHTALRSVLWKCKPVKWKVDDEMDWRTANLYQLVVANGKFFGGGMQVAPQAELTSGHLDVVSFRDVGVLDVAMLPKVYTGVHTEDKKVHYTKGARVTAEPNYPVMGKAGDVRKLAEQEQYTCLVEADGEVVGKLPATWEVIPAALSLIFPLPAAD